MNTTTLRAALARVDWSARAAAGLQLTWLVAQLIAAAAVFACRWLHAHRQQIRAALVATIAAVITAAQLTYAAGCHARRWLEATSARSAALVAAQPLPAVAPITASLQALREALERWVKRLYPATA